MADKKISALTSATTPLDGTEILPIVQSSTTVKVANNDLRPKQIQSNATSGVLQVAGPSAASTRVMTTPDANFNAARIDAAQSFTGDQTLSTGNIIQGTAAKGINFTANSPASGMTTQLLNWYEEGTWTPTQGSGLTVVGTFSSSGNYIRVGKLVYLNGFVSGSTSVAFASGGAQICGGLPFTVSGTGALQVGNGINSANTVTASCFANGTSVNSGASFAANARYDFSVCYRI